MPLEILSRTVLPIVPDEPEELARKADLGAHYAALAPTNPHVGALWATPDAQLSVWTGTEWLRLAAEAPPPSGDEWGGGRSWGTGTWG